MMGYQLIYIQRQILLRLTYVCLRSPTLGNMKLRS
ncbi:hypothetical protein Leryth_019893 [Lithospermum erythrorhizon]|nr:hypothetical protein Leryth_019893 [Lithospermum erythrorhizon]